MELTAGGKSLVEVKIQKGIFQEDVIAMMLLSHLLLQKALEKINHQMYMDDIKLFTKNEKELEALIQMIRTSI